MSHKNIDTWFGVTVQCGRVTALNIDNNNLTGTIPVAIGDLPALRILQLNLNHLTGGIPSSIGNLGDLDKLILDQNQLTGPLPPELGNLTLLTILYLNDNKFTGSFPEEFGNLNDNFRELRLYNNQMTGPISVLTNLDAATNIYLERNHFNGHLTEAFTDLIQLKTLTTSDNLLSGTIPVNLDKLQNLYELALDNNQFTGTIPAGVTTLPLLWFLTLSDNQLTGTIPSNLGDLTALKILNLSHNPFDDAPFPGSLVNCSLLEEMTLETCQLTGPLPQFLGTLSHLVSVNLGYNKLTGKIIDPATPPPTLLNLNSLRFLSLGNNLLDGHVPAPGVGQLPVLELLDLGGNQLDGSIPPELGNLKALQTLSLGVNLLTGNIPPQLGNLPALTDIYLTNNQLDGPIPKEFANDTNLHSLWLYVNKLTGTLPKELGQLHQLKALGVAENFLTGSLPKEYAALTNLETFQANDNFFTGPFPPEYLAWTNLKELYLSDNPLLTVPRDNKFTSVPDFGANLQKLSLEGNELTFESIEPYVAHPPSLAFTYAPQGPVGSLLNPTIRAGCPFTPNANVGGSHNTYQWFKGGVSIPGASSPALSIATTALTDAGIYTAQVSNSVVTGLTIQTRPITLTVTPPVNTLLALDPANQLCNVQHLYATPSGLFSYQWYLDGRKIIGATSDKYDAFYSGNYTVSYQPDAVSCFLTTPILATTGLYGDASPAVTGSGTPVNKLTTNYSASGYQWYVNDKVIANATTADLAVYYNGTYYLVVRLANNCQYRSNTIVVNESKYTSLLRISADGDTVRLEDPSDIVRIYPNPVQHVVQIEAGVFSLQGIEFFDISNKLIYKREFTGTPASIQVDVSHWEPGVYILSLWSEEKRIWRKLVKY